MEFIIFILKLKLRLKLVLLIIDFKNKNFRIETTNILKKDKSKENLTIEKYFDESFVGGIQKLRIYNRVLNNNEILNNAINDFENDHYNVKILKGGRLIYE